MGLRHVFDALTVECDERNLNMSKPVKQNSWKIDASTVILGFTGPIGAGCSFISSMIPQISTSKKYSYYKLSDIIREVLKSEGVKKPSIPQLQNKGNELRKEKTSHLIALLLDKVNQEWKPDEDYGIIIDGIKNEGEVNALSQFPYFFLFSIQASVETRSERVITAKIFKNLSEFAEADLRDQLEDYRYGQQVSKCSYLSDVIISNETDFPWAATDGKEAFVRGIYNRYIKLIEDLHERKQPSARPTTDEMCMTIAYALSKSSSCLKRKVGCVIVDQDKIEKQEGAASEGKQEILPSIVSSGYNEVPLGSYQCLYHPDYQECYRDYLQEVFAKTLKHCPACGVKIEIKAECPFCQDKYSEFVKSCKKCHQEIDYIFICNGCGQKIFNSYLPGSKGAAGKLLDMCRALHAEEVSLLKLSRKASTSDSNLVLYVTTQPCNLCSNKIVLSGIKKVVYSEPYSMTEAREILKSGKVEVIKFEGVKSSAFFRLYP